MTGRVATPAVAGGPQGQVDRGRRPGAARLRGRLARHGPGHRRDAGPAPTVTLDADADPANAVDRRRPGRGPDARGGRGRARRRRPADGRERHLPDRPQPDPRGRPGPGDVHGDWGSDERPGSLGRQIHIIPSGAQNAIGGELRVPVSIFDIRGEAYYVANRTREAVEGYQLTNTERLGRVRGTGWYAQVSAWPFGDAFVTGDPGLVRPTRSTSPRRPIARRRASRSCSSWPASTRRTTVARAAVSTTGRLPVTRTGRRPRTSPSTSTDSA